MAYNSVFNKREFSVLFIALNTLINEMEGEIYAVYEVDKTNASVTEMLEHALLIEDANILKDRMNLLLKRQH